MKTVLELLKLADTAHNRIIGCGGCGTRSGKYKYLDKLLYLSVHIWWITYLHPNSISKYTMIIMSSIEKREHRIGAKL